MKYVLLTGGAGGLGGATAKFLADKGITVLRWISIKRR